MPGKIAVLASTKGTVLQGIIDAVREGGLVGKVDVVISDCAGCGALEKAEASGIETVLISPEGKTREDFDKELMQELTSRDIDLILLIGFMRILSQDFVSEWGNKALNIHPSLLPAFAGGMDVTVHNQVLASGVKISGCTLHFISNEADAGPIALQQSVPVKAEDTPHTLKERVQDAEKEVVVKGANLFLKGKMKLEGNKVKVLG